MAASPTILDSDFRYIDKKGNLLRTRTELTVAQMLTFLEEEYEYDHELTLNGKTFKIDFKTQKGLIEVIDPSVQVEVKIQLVHVSTATVLAEVKVTTTFTVMLQVTHGSGHVLDPV